MCSSDLVVVGVVVCVVVGVSVGVVVDVDVGLVVGVVVVVGVVGIVVGGGSEIVTKNINKQNSDAFQQPPVPTSHPNNKNPDHWNVLLSSESD